MHQKIVILDFGGQYAHLIANRIRRLGVYSEIRDGEIAADELKNYKGIILSGGPASVHAEESPKCDPEIFNLGIPVLGICYGHQLIQHTLGGKVEHGKTKEYGLAELSVTSPVKIFESVAEESRVWMSHFDYVSQPADGFKSIGTTPDCPTAALADMERNFYGIQFHAEVTHSPEGMKILDNFLNICEVGRDWSIEEFIKEEIEAIKDKVGDKKVFLLVSGGVDSTVCFALLEKALGSDRVYGLLVDHGLMRYKEAEQVTKTLNDAGFTNLHVAEKSDEFLGALEGKYEPEVKRKIIGDMFWKVKEDVAEELKLNPDEWIMGQGTIYPDTIETGGTKHADTIKTHHNRVDLVQKMIDKGKVIEPIAQLYKDEVRDLGEKLGLPHEMVWRQPFPGPGLGVRILCAESPVVKSIEKPSEILTVDGMLSAILPIKSVGVQGDERTYRHPIAFWANNPEIICKACQDWDELEKTSTLMTNTNSDVNRVLLTLKGEFSDKIYLKSCDLSRDRIELLQKIDDLVTQHMIKAPSDYDIWQFPVVLAPVSSVDGKESIILRPIVSTEAMTASFAQIDWDLLDKMSDEIMKHDEITHVFYDLTHKPPGTIEWE